jgi:hypothetical protein
MSLSKNAIKTFEDGLRVATVLSFDESSLANLIGTVDILLTDLPPTSYRGSQSSVAIKNMLSKLQPRYHISSFNDAKFYEQEPYENFDDAGSFLFPTRFLTVGSALSSEKVCLLLNIIENLYTLL